MTVTRKTDTGYLVCEWEDGDGVRRERMIFPELLVEDAAPPERQKSRGSDH